jgi:hypothetical protein
MDIDDIPLEVLQLIIEYVRHTGTRADLGRLACSCRRLANLVPVSLHFLVHFSSNFGEIVYVVGNTPELGMSFLRFSVFYNADNFSFFCLRCFSFIL